MILLRMRHSPLWYARYRDIFEHEMTNPPDAVKIGTLLRRFSSATYEQYRNFILPKGPTELSFQDTIDTLTKIFDNNTPVSVSFTRCLSVTEDVNEDIYHYASYVKSSSLAH